MSHPPPGSPDHLGDAPQGPPRPAERRRGAGPIMPGVAAALVLLVVVTGGSTLFLWSSRSVAGPLASTSIQAPPTGVSGPARASPSGTGRAAGPTPAPPAPAPSASSAPSAPSAGSPSRRAPPGPNRSLKANSIYGIDLGGRRVSCGLRVRSPRPPLKDSALAPYLREVVDCLVETFQKPLAAQGFSLAAPTVQTFAQQIKTPCGIYRQDRAPAFYCSATQTIYWARTSDEGDEAYTYARLGYVGLVAHEFGHHLQAVTGMLYAYGRNYYGTEVTVERQELTRRLELQAQCFEGVFLDQVARSVRLRPADRTQLRTWHGYTGDEDPPSDRLPDHGTSASQIRWLERGFDSADLGRCNTWKAAANLVR